MVCKTLLVFCDGTGKDGALGLPKSSRPAQDSATQIVLGVDASAQGIHSVGYGRTSSPQFLTNVLRLARSVKSVDKWGNPQIVFYQSGVGSEANFQGDPVDGMTKLQALGTAAASKIRDAYVFLAQNYEKGDKICLFGASRGAYTARKLSVLIDKIGLLTRKHLGLFFGIWLTLVDHPDRIPTTPEDTRRPDIDCVGVWDTVGGIYQEIDALNIADSSLPTTVKVALHALSMQENREKFLPTLWEPRNLASGQVLKQVWFAGAHTDLGGGYERHELADIALFWMAGEVQSLIDINLDLEFLRSYSQLNPDPWGTSQPHNAYVETPGRERPSVGHETRLESGQITKQSVFHESVQYSPTDLDQPEYMITVKDIIDKYGSLLYAPLNKFEKCCKDHWAQGVSYGDMPDDIDDIGIIIRPQWTSLVDGFIPLTAIVGGNWKENKSEHRLYVARGHYQGGIYPGKASPQSAMVYITFKEKQISIPLSDTNAVEVLVGDQPSVSWATIKSSPFSLEQLDGAVPVPGGNEADTILYVAQATFENGVHCGKVKVDDIARIPLDGREECVADSYQVLVYA